MGRVPRFGSVTAVFVAGLIAYFAYAAGAEGPTVIFGRRDANIASASAWVQIPVHAGVALGFAAAGPLGLRLMAWTVSYFATMVLSLWATYMVIAGLSDLGAYTDALDVLVSALLLLLYGAAFTLSRHSLRSTPDA